MQRTLRDIVDMGSDPAQEGHLYEDMRRLRQGFGPDLLRNVTVASPDKARARAQEAIGVALAALFDVRQVADGDPGHGPGHWMRDYVHSLLLGHDDVTFTPVEILVGMVAGTLHDIGTLIVPRYKEKDRAVRHAEVGALAVRAAVLEAGVMNEYEADALAWAIAAHTHYPGQDQVMCRDGVRRVVEPYADEFNGWPFQFVWFPRWVDRLDCSGPCLVGRHFLTLKGDHEDYGGSEVGHYKVSFGTHLEPLFRTFEEIKRQGRGQHMTEHLRMFAESQTNQSMYGRFDRGRMVERRDANRAALLRILARIERPDEGLDQETVLTAWESFLGNTIEPSNAGQQTARELCVAFRQLPQATRCAWISGFLATMQEYLAYAPRLLAVLDDYPSARLPLPGFPQDIRACMTPQPAWADLLQGM